MESGRNGSMIYKITKKIKFILLLSVVLTLMCGCQNAVSPKDETGNNSDGGEVSQDGALSDEEKPIDYKALADELKGIIKDDTMTEMDSKLLSATYGIDTEKIEDLKVYLSSGSTANEVAVFSCKDENDVQSVIGILEDRVKTRKASYKDYNAEEAKKLENAIIGSKGRVAILVVAEDVEGAKEILNKY